MALPQVRLSIPAYWNGLPRLRGHRITKRLADSIRDQRQALQAGVIIW